MAQQLKKIQYKSKASLPSILYLLSALKGDKARTGMRTATDPLTGEMQAWQFGENGEIIKVGVPQAFFEKYPDVKLLQLADVWGSQYSSQLLLSDEQVREKLLGTMRRNTNTMGYNWNDKQLNTFVNTYMDAYHPNQRLKAQNNLLVNKTNYLKVLTGEEQGYVSMAAKYNKMLTDMPPLWWEHAGFVDTQNLSSEDYDRLTSDSIAGKPLQESYEKNFITPINEKYQRALNSSAYKTTVKNKDIIIAQIKNHMASMAGITTGMSEQAYKEYAEKVLLNPQFQEIHFQLKQLGTDIVPADYDGAQLWYNAIKQYSNDVGDPSILDNINKQYGIGDAIKSYDDLMQLGLSLPQTPTK